MMQMITSGVALQEEMIIDRSAIPPVVRLSSKLTIDDTILEKPTLLMGQVGSGKSSLLIHSVMPQIFEAMSPDDAAVIFASKREMIDGFYDPAKGDILLDYDAAAPENIWNIFEEMRASRDAKKTLTELCDVMFSKHKNTVQPFFTNAPKDMFRTLVLYLYNHYERQTGKKPTNGTLIGFFETLTMKDIVRNGRIQKGLLTLLKEIPELGHLQDYVGDGKSAQALGVLGELRAVLNEVFQGGAFTRAGNFSVGKALTKGSKVFLLYNFAENTESALLFYDMIIDQFIKKSLQENGQKVWFILDEFSLLGHLQYLEQAMAAGRSSGFRLIAAVQSVQLMEKNYRKEEADCILSLFPNIFCFFTSDCKTRELLSARYGMNLVTVSGRGSTRVELMERKAILDSDFFKITRPGDCIVSLAGYEPFIFRNHRL